jgi:hypothetical protein
MLTETLLLFSTSSIKKPNLVGPPSTHHQYNNSHFLGFSFPSFTSLYTPSQQIIKINTQSFQTTSTKQQ